MTNKAKDLPAVMKMAMVALRLIAGDHRSRGCDCMLARITPTAIMQARLAAVAISSHNQEKLHVLQLREDMVGFIGSFSARLFSTA